MMNLQLDSAADRRKWVWRLPLAVMLFWLIVQPFYFGQYRFDTKLLVLFAYGLIALTNTYFALIGFERWVPHTYNRLKENNKLHLLYLSFVLFSGILVFLFKVIFGFYPLSLERLATGALAIIGILIPCYLFLRYITKPQAKIETPLLTIGKHRFALEEILFFTTEGNYLLVFLYRNGTIVQVRIRGRLLDVPHHQGLFACHKGFIISTDKISTIGSNGQNPFVQLMHYDKQIPVSRTKKKELEQSIHHQ